MEIHQLLHAAAPGDAITNAALHYRELLRRVTKSEIYAVHVDQRLSDDVKPLHEYGQTASARAGRNLLLYHLSTGSPEMMAFLVGRSEAVGVIYHNITPASFFEPYDTRVSAELVGGRRDVADLRHRASFAIAVSAFNARELETEGYRNVVVVPMVADVKALRRLTPDASMARYLDATVEGPLVLFVGQLQPHKRPDFLLAAHHVLTTYQLPEAHLALVGPARLPLYRAAVARFSRELNLAVSLVGWVTAPELAAFYARADVFVTASEHEGFCVPLLEAMSFDVPVVARAFASVPDTLDGAGLLLDARDGPEVMAEAVAAVLGDERLSADLVARGRARVESADQADVADAFLQQLLELV
jgi:glycosyltransferase involved in cell wall biosynthesis